MLLPKARYSSLVLFFLCLFLLCFCFLFVLFVFLFLFVFGGFLLFFFLILILFCFFVFSCYVFFFLCFLCHCPFFFLFFFFFFTFHGKGQYTSGIISSRYCKSAYDCLQYSKRIRKHLRKVRMESSGGKEGRCKKLVTKQKQKGNHSGRRVCRVKGINIV